MIALLSGIDDARTRMTSIAERGVLQGLNAGCDLAIGSFAYFNEDKVVLLAELGNPATGQNQKIRESTKIKSVSDFEAAYELGLLVASKFER